MENTKHKENSITVSMSRPVRPAQHDPGGRRADGLRHIITIIVNNDINSINDMNTHDNNSIVIIISMIITINVDTNISNNNCLYV